MKTIQIGLIGCGTVGTGVARLLIEKNVSISKKAGNPLHLKRVAVSDIHKKRDVPFAEGILTDRPEDIVNDPDIDIVIEMMGGEDLAGRLVNQAIENSKHVVTANKALLSKKGNEIFKKAAEKGVEVAFEASIAGCIPIVKTLREALVGNTISQMSGILNGTCNYILSKITHEGIEFESALDSAQKEGYAEADPTLDVGGYDTAHKLAILSALAYGMRINYDDIHIEGIEHITPMDIQFAEQFSYRIKLLAISKNRKEGIEARVHPTMIPFDNMLSNVSSTFNAVSITGDAISDMLLYGHGAGMMPTASAVISDIVDISRVITRCTDGRIRSSNDVETTLAPLKIIPITEIIMPYYFRFTVHDKPGVLSKISGILGKHHISLKFVIQKGRKVSGSVPLVMLSHPAKEANVNKAMAEIRALDVVETRPMVIRIEEPLKNE